MLPQSGGDNMSMREVQDAREEDISKERRVAPVQHRREKVDCKKLREYIGVYPDELQDMMKTVIDSYERTHYAYISEKEMSDKIEKIESALGFELYTWQKTYLERGRFRVYGESTAKMLRELTDIKDAPIDLRRCNIRNRTEKIYADDLKEMQRLLNRNGIECRDIRVDAGVLKGNFVL